MALPPGQHRTKGFPRFGTHLHQPPPDIPDDPVIEIGGAVGEPFEVPLAALRQLPRTEQTSDFHCVSGWSATDLRWEGVRFSTFYEQVVAPKVPAGETVTHLVFGGLDRYKSVVSMEDALGDDVLLADRLDGAPLDTDHGAPVRLLSPSQYGYISTKHLCRIEAHTTEPEDSYATATAASLWGLRALGFTKYSRARVWQEERGGWLPNAIARPIYRLIIPPIRFLSQRGSRER